MPSRLQWILLFCFMLISPNAFAAEVVPWKSYLFFVMTIAAIIGGYFAYKNPKAEGGMTKFLLAGLYFWLITFAQLIILSLLYYFTK